MAHNQVPHAPGPRGYNPPLASVEAFFFLFVAAWAAFGILQIVRSSERSRKYLAAAHDEAPLEVGHLSPALSRLAHETRFLRISLEGPIRDVAEFRSGEFAQSAGEDLDAFDNMLMNVTRQLDDWVHAVERLPDAERATFEGLGLSAGPIRAALENEGWSFERQHLERPGQPPMERRLARVAEELARIEAALQVQQQPYR